jgi:hypothetical protein
MSGAAEKQKEEGGVAETSTYKQATPTGFEVEFIL